MKTHMLSHTENRSYPCGVCCAVFRRACDYEKHRNVHGRDDVTSATMPNLRLADGLNRSPTNRADDHKNTSLESNLDQRSMSDADTDDMMMARDLSDDIHDTVSVDDDDGDEEDDEVDICVDIDD